VEAGSSLPKEDPPLVLFPKQGAFALALELRDVAGDLITSRDIPKVHRIYDAFTNSGIVYDEDNNSWEQFTLKDLLTTGDLTRFIPTVVSYIVQEALEPATLVVGELFQEIRIERGRRVQIGSVGAIHVEDIPEGGDYPEIYPDMDGGPMVGFGVEKVGVMIHFTDEMIEDTQFDVIGLWLRAAGRAFARHKEIKALKLLDEMGVTVYDNKTPTDSQKGVCTGRDITGAQNGSMTMNDVFEMYAFLALRGFTPTHWITNPLSWAMFLTDSEVREVVMAGNTLISNRTPQGQASQGWPTEFAGLGRRFKATGEGPENPDYGPNNADGRFGANPFVQTLNPLQSTLNIPPRGLPSVLTMLVSPWMPYQSNAGLSTSAADGADAASVVMADRNATGALVRRQDMRLEEFDKPLQDIRGMKMNERYGFVALEQGRGVAVAKNVIIARNYVFENSNAVTLPALDDGLVDGSPTFV